MVVDDRTDPDERVRILAELLSLYNRKMTKGAFQLMMESLDEIKYNDQLSRAVKAATKKGRFCPTPGDIWNAHVELERKRRTSDEYMKLVSKVKRWLRKNLGWRSGSWIIRREEVREALLAMGYAPDALYYDSFHGPSEHDS